MTPEPIAAELRVAIDARIVSGETGGIEGVLAGLAAGLSGLEDGNERYLFLALEGEDEWLRSYVSGPCSIEVVQRPRRLRTRIANAAPWVASAWRRRPGDRSAPPGPPPSDGTIERAAVDVMHFMVQGGFRTATPSIYHPHDLQHLHLPEFFTGEQIALRERWYRTLCKQASMVAVASSWTKRDVESQYDLPPEKVRVVPLAPPTAAYGGGDSAARVAARRRLHVPPRYILYPAQTWRHKNHVSVLRALAELRDAAGLTVPFVAPGKQTDYFGELLAEAEALGISDQVMWPGFVTTDELVALYEGATAVVIPSRFEAASAPLWEAFRAGVPAACSNVTSLPEQAGDAAIVFDPDDIPGIASAVRRLWTEPKLRQVLVSRGLARVGAYNWDTTARTFRAHYRRIGNRPLTAEDRVLLADPAVI